MRPDRITLAALEGTRLSSGKKKTKSSSYHEVLPLDARTCAMLVGKVIEGFIERILILHEVNDHVECVENTHRVSAERSTLWMIDVDTCEQGLGIGFQFNQSAQIYKKVQGNSLNSYRYR